MKVLAFQPNITARAKSASASTTSSEADVSRAGGSAPTYRLSAPGHRVRLIDRPGLLDRLDDGLQCRCTLIQAPAGHGKTVLMSQWREHLTRQGKATAWLNAERNDGPGELLHWLRIALAQAGLVMPADRAGRVCDVEADLAVILENLAGLRSELVILLDEYHVAQSGQTDELMARFIRAVPDTVRIVIATRCRPMFNLTALRARGHLAEIGQDLLRFDDQEAAGLLQPSLLPAAAQALNRDVEGWPIALQLANLRVRGGGDGAIVRHSLAGSAGEMADYIEAQIFADLPGDLQSFLIETSILDVIDAAAADAVRGRGDARAHIEMVRRMNVLIAPADQDRPGLRHHRVFADFLTMKRAALAPAHLAGLHRAAADWFEQTGDCVRAVRHARESGNRDTDRLLTNRESQILAELARGHSNKLIARHLDLSEDGIKFHLKNIYRKLGANARVTALNVAREMNII